MKNNRLLLSLYLSVAMTLCVSSPLHAEYVLRGKKLVNVKYLATLSDQEHFDAGVAAFEKENWDEALSQFQIVLVNFPSSPLYREAKFYAGVGYFNLNDIDLANKYVSEYLATKIHSEHFEQAWHYKFDIAEKFSEGVRKHLFGLGYMPRIVFASKGDAIDIYDEIVSVLAGHELAVKALYSKGSLLAIMKEYDDAIEAYNMIIRRFPRHDNAPDSYCAIAKLYEEQSKSQVNNINLLELAKINIRKFREAFPKDNRISDAEVMLKNMKEIYARGIYETGQFYEKIKKPSASVLYYFNAIRQFPETDVAKMCRERLEVLHEEVERLSVKD